MATELTTNGDMSNVLPIASKKPERTGAFMRPVITFPNARSAFKAYLLSLGLSSFRSKVLLPSYIGWSPNEGSGVFDPIQEVGTGFAFYRIRRDLTIDLEDLIAKMTADHNVKLLVVIHYFGYPDPCLREAVAFAKRLGVPVLEDEAHSLFSDWVGGVCGRLGDAAIFSLHKLLPFKSGGLLQLMPPVQPRSLRDLECSPLRRPLEGNILDYDLLEISRIRRRNAARLLKDIKPLRPAVLPLRPILPAGVVPQSLPVIINEHSRDDLYFKLNAAGFGVVSLYHTLIDPIQPKDYPESHWLAKRILNLPCHQYISVNETKALVAKLSELL